MPSDRKSLTVLFCENMPRRAGCANSNLRSAGGCPLNGFTLPSSAKAGGLQSAAEGGLPFNSHRVSIKRIYRTQQGAKSIIYLLHH